VSVGDIGANVGDLDSFAIRRICEPHMVAVQIGGVDNAVWAAILAVEWMIPFGPFLNDKQWLFLRLRKQGTPQPVSPIIIVAFFLDEAPVYQNLNLLELAIIIFFSELDDSVLNRKPYDMNQPAYP
jgi:hypothetical protein